MPFDRPDRVFVRFIVEQLPHGVVGLVLGRRVRGRDVDPLELAQLLGHRRGDATSTGPLVRPDASPHAPAARHPRASPLVFGLVQIARRPSAARCSARRWSSPCSPSPASRPGSSSGCSSSGSSRSASGQRAAFAGLLLGLAEHHGGGLRHDAGLAVVHAGRLARDASRFGLAGELGVAGAAPVEQAPAAGQSTRISCGWGVSRAGRRPLATPALDGRRLGGEDRRRRRRRARGPSRTAFVPESVSSQAPSRTHSNSGCRRRAISSPSPRAQGRAAAGSVTRTRSPGSEPRGASAAAPPPTPRA